LALSQKLHLKNFLAGQKNEAQLFLKCIFELEGYLFKEIFQRNFRKKKTTSQDFIEANARLRSIQADKKS